MKGQGRRMNSRLRNISLLLAGSVALAGSAFAQNTPDYGPLKPVLKGDMPGVVPAFPFAAAPVDTRPMFDYFMWQNFIAAMWPAQPGSHGQPLQPDNPNIFRNPPANTQPVWLGWKTAYELFPQNGSAPPAWDQSGNTNVCRGVSASDTRPVLMMVSKFGTVAEELNQAFAGPLPDQTGLFTRYEVRVDRPYYDYVRARKLYNRSNWPTGKQPPIVLPASSDSALGSIEVKGAWRDLSKVPERFQKRFYTELALVAVPDTCSIDPGTQRVVCDCRSIKAGLVGFHIAHKTQQFPQWVWSTFEQVDNLGEDPTTPKDMQPSYYDPDYYKKYGGPRSNPPDHPGASRVPKADDFDHTPVNVVRLSQIPSTPAGNSTMDFNQRYRALMKGTVWENYVLIGTQWSTLPSWPPQTPKSDFGCEDGTLPTAGGLAFPACGVSNITMETYHQLDSCQNCHQGAQRSGADFSWILANRAYTPGGTTNSIINGLKTLPVKK